MNTVEPLQKHRATLIEVVRVLPMATPVGKLVAKIQPFHLHKDLETLWRSSQERAFAVVYSNHAILVLS